MSFRRLVTALVVVPVLAGGAVSAPASATTTGVNEGLAGTVATAQELGNGGKVQAGCTFAGVLTPANTLIVEFGGFAAATGPVNNAAPLLTAVTCEINNASEGGKQSQKQDFAANGAVSVTASSTLLTTDGPKEWPVMDITVCVQVLVVFGPFPVTVYTSTQACVTP